jgi:CubicO group peptidase (beta-lactamase class C family)
MTIKRITFWIVLIAMSTPATIFSQTSGYPKQDLLNSLNVAIGRGEYPNIDSIVLSENGRVIYEKYFNGLTQDSVNDTRSSFKSITSLLMGIAIDKGFIKRVDQKVYSFFPEYESYSNWDSRKANMTIRDLLEMKSGYDCEEWDDTKDCEEKMMASDDWVKFSLDLPMSHDPGTVWAYSSSNAMVLGGIIAGASKMPISEFADKFLFQPLGIKQYRWTKDPRGHGMTAGSFYMLPSDMLKIGELVLNKGFWRGKRIVSGKWIEEAIRPITKIENFSNVKISRTESAIPEPTYYGYTWYNEEMRTNTFKHNVVFASGNGGQYIMIISDLKLVAVFTGHSYNSWKSKLPFEVLIKYVLPYLIGKHPSFISNPRRAASTRNGDD